MASGNNRLRHPIALHRRTSAVVKARRFAVARDFRRCYVYKTAKQKVSRKKVSP